MGIVELGEKTFTSTTTVKRFCRKLGVDSYTDFRMLLSAAQDNYAHRSNMNEAQAPISRYDSVTEILEKVSQQNAQANTEGCLAFLISYTGETEDIIEVAQTLRRLHVTTVALTSSTSNSLASQCDYKLRVDSSESWDRLGGMSSRISTLSIIDALFTALLNTNYDQYVRNMADTCVGNRVRGE